MNRHFPLVVGATIAAGVALVLALAPGDWLAGPLELAETDATSFLLRRYAASATLALAVVAGVVALRGDPIRAALLGFGTWFAVQALVAILGIVSGTVGGLAWLALFADPAIAAWFFVLAGRRPVDRAGEGGG
jgi:hypothetical protein